MGRNARYSLLGLGLLLAVGCNGGKKSRIEVVRYPDFYQPELKRVAVLPFASDGQLSDKDAGQRIGQRLETALVRNGTYEVYTRQHLKDVLNEQDLAASGIIEGEAAQRIGKLGSVQAIICGVCNQYGSGTRQEVRTQQVPVWGTNAKGWPVITGYREQQYLWTCNEAAAQCNVVVIDTATGRQIAGVNELSHGVFEGSPPRYSEWQTMQLTETDQIVRILRSIAVVKAEIKLKGTVLRTATGQYDAEWDKQDRFIPEDKLFAVVKLPVEAARNSFRITIVPKEGREVLAEQSFEWPDQTTENAYEFDVRSIMEKQGCGDYQIKLYSGPAPVAWYNFSIVQKRKG